jgi:hypothetical protein
LVNAPVGVRVVLAVEIHHRSYDRSRLLGSGGVVKIDEALAVDLPLQYWEVLPHLLDIERLGLQQM